MASNPLDAAGKLAKDSLNLAVGGVTTSARIAMKSEELMEETIRTMRAARPIIDALGRALEAGLDEDIKRLLQTAADTQDDVRAAREAVERLVGIINTTIDGVGGAPGVGLILKSLGRLGGGTPKVPSPVAAGVSASAGAVKVGAGAAKAGAGAAKAGSAAARKVAPKKKPAAPKK
jgi:hypothetical protein